MHINDYSKTVNSVEFKGEQQKQKPVAETYSFQTWTDYFSNQKLQPYFVSLLIAMYYVHFHPIEEATRTAMFWKCLPNALLAIYISLQEDTVSQAQKQYRIKIMSGLMFSVFGDAYLAWPGYFLNAIFGYSLAQVLYISAMGFDITKTTMAKFLFGLNAVVLIILMPGMLSGDKFLAMGVIIYSFLLVTMTWRAFARINTFDDLKSFPMLCCCLGAIFFSISDLVVGLDRFYEKIYCGETLLMGSYYIAQLGLTFSIFYKEKSPSAF